MTVTLPEMGLTQWNQTTDFFNYVEHAGNMQSVDDHDHTPDMGKQIPTDGIQNVAINDTKIASEAVTGAKIQAESIDISKLTQNFLFNLIPTVSSLPVSPYDGQQIIFLADAASGVTWNLRWRESSNRWEVLGSSGSITADLITTQSLAGSIPYTDMTTVGPSVALPLAGVYIIEFGGFLESSVNTGSTNFYLSFSAPNSFTSSASDADSVAVALYEPTGGGAAVGNQGRRLTRLTTYGASVATLKYRRFSSVGSVATSQISRRWISASPQWIDFASV